MNRQKIRLLLITEDFPPMIGGVATFLQNICLFTKMYISVLTTQMNHCQDFDRAQKYPIKRLLLRPRMGFITILLNAFLLIRERKINIVFWGDFDTAAIAGWLLKMLLQTKFIMLVHGTRLYIALSAGFIIRWLSLFILRQCDLIFTNSHYNKRRLCDLGVPPGKIRIFHPGVDTRLFHPTAESSNLQRDYCLSDQRILLTVGRLVKKKNHEMVLKVLPQIIKEVPNVLYLIVGDGPEKERLKDLAMRLNMDKHVVFIGYSTGETLVRLYNLCDVYIMISRDAPPEGTKGSPPTDVETFGIAFLEANACAKPVIGGNSGGVSDAIVHGGTGYLVDPNNEDELKEAILDLLLCPEKSKQMGENGRKRVVNEFSWDRLVERFDEELILLLK